MSNLVLCMAKQVGETTYRFFFQEEEIAPDFYGDKFEQKPASICKELEPEENSYSASFTAEATEGKNYETSDRSNLFSMQDGLDNCVSLMFDRDYDEGSPNERFVLHFGDNIYDVSDKLFKYGFELDEEFPQREPTDFLTRKLSTIGNTNPDELVLCMVKMHDKMKIREDLTSYTYDAYFIKKSRIPEFRSSDDWFFRRESQLYSVDLKDFNFDKHIQFMCDNIQLDTIQEQNDYSVIECIDGCVCLAYENIDGKEYPENRIVLNIGDTEEEMIGKLGDRASVI